MDILHDNSFRVLRTIADIVGESGMPEYVMHNNVPDQKTASNLADGAFADDVNRMYPIDTPHATWLAGAYLEYHTPEVEPAKQAAVRDFTRDRILEAAEIYGIREDVESVMSKIAASKSPCITEDDYGMPEQKKYRVTSCDELKVACDYFSEYRGRYPASDRERVSRFLMKKAGEYGVPFCEIPHSVCRDAGYGIPDREFLMREINERARISKNAEAGLLLANLNIVLDAADDDIFSENMEKIAAIIDDFDVIEGFDDQQGKLVPFASDILYGQSIEKVASTLDSAVVLGQEVLDARKLASVLTPDILSSSFGKDFSKSCVSDGDAIDPTLLKQALDGLDTTGKHDFLHLLQVMCD